ncbi:MAG: hypothetical protein GY869_24060, partial [Planctomycetes bacterium]|nr:hypothetical protein [Planctomycetota bacterium]
MINGYQYIDFGSGDWEIGMGLAQGNNELGIWLEDYAGNPSPSLFVDIFVDSVAPAVLSMTPADASFVNIAPATVGIEYREDTSTLSLENSSLLIKDSGNGDVQGDWVVSGISQLTFTPLEPFADDTYSVDLQLEDTMGNRSDIILLSFTVDTVPPPAPVLDPVSSPTHNPNQLIIGSKESYDSILLNNGEIIPHTPETAWQYQALLVSGDNRLNFVARDRAGNISDNATLEIFFDDSPPLAVETLTVNGSGSGTNAFLDWSGYDESIHGDISHYLIYVELNDFNNISGLTENGSVSAGSFIYLAENLISGNQYFFAVVAVDGNGNFSSQVTTVSAIITDTVVPGDVSGLETACTDTTLLFTWEVPDDPFNDVAGYHVYFNGATVPDVLTPELTSYEQTGLAPASDYAFTIKSFDASGNESNGVSTTGITLLDNPSGLNAVAHTESVALTWSPSEPAGFVSHYNIYVSQTDFTSTDGMSPHASTGATSRTIHNLTNGVTYYFAVTTVNNSGCEDDTVSTAPGTPWADTT